MEKSIGISLEVVKYVEIIKSKQNTRQNFSRQTPVLPNDEIIVTILRTYNMSKPSAGNPTVFERLSQTRKMMRRERTRSNENRR